MIANILSLLRQRLAALLLPITPWLAGCASVAEPLRVDLAVRNVSVVDTRTGAVQRGRTLWVKGDRIAAVTHSTKRHSASVDVDGRGSFAVPGLWDAHVHLLQNNATAAAQAGPQQLGYGITHVRDMGSSTAALVAFKQAPLAATMPEVIASGPAFWAYELPYGDKSQQRIVGNAADIESAVGDVAKSGAAFIKVYAGFQPLKLATLASVARRAGLRIAGHAQPGAPLDTQATLGLSTVEHLETSTFIGCDVDPEAYFERIIAARFRNSGETLPKIMDAFVQDIDRKACTAMLRRAAEAGLAITPTLTASFLPPSTAKRLSAMLPAARREDCALYLTAFRDNDAAEETRYAAARNALMAMVRESGMPILAGTDSPAFCGTAGPSLALELALLREAGLSPLEVLQSATLVPARIFGFEDRLGFIAQAMQADFVLLRANPLADATAYAAPVGVVANGRWHDEAALAKLRAP